MHKYSLELKLFKKWLIDKGYDQVLLRDIKTANLKYYSSCIIHLIPDAVKLDRTMSRCVKFARMWGYGGIYIGNLSPYIATDPADLRNLSSEELQPKENNDCVAFMMSVCELHVLAYGNPSRAMLIPDRQ